MTTKNIMALAIIIAGLAGLTWISRPGQAQNEASTSSKASNSQASAVETKTAASGMLTALQRSHDFGKISMKDGLVSMSFRVSNSSADDVLLESVVTSCMCTKAYVVAASGTKGPYGMPGHGRAVPKANMLVKAGESVDIRVVFDPNAHGPAGVGAMDRQIHLTDSSGKRLTLQIKGVVTP